VTFDIAADALRQALGQSDAPVVRTGAPHREGPRQRILCLSDLHAPFTRLDLLAHIFRHEAADVLVINGDTDDGYMTSRYPKRQHVPFVQSLGFAKAMVEEAARRYPTVLIIEGNHDGPRFERLLRASLPLDAIDAIRVMAGGTLSPIQAIVKDYPNVEVVGHYVAQGPFVGFFHQLGDVLFTHAHKFSSRPGNAVQAVDDHFQRFSKVLKIAPYRVLIQAHTHQLSWLPVGPDRLLVESGCLCQTMEYQLEDRLGGLPQRLGYVTLEMQGGRVDIGSVRTHWLE
jgi:hypothetical protein